MHCKGLTLSVFVFFTLNFSKSTMNVTSWPLIGQVYGTNGNVIFDTDFFVFFGTDFFVFFGIHH